MKLYISWVDGIAYSPEALDILYNSPAVDGIELSQRGLDQIEHFHQAGLRVSIHNIVRNLKGDLCHTDFLDLFRKYPELRENLKAMDNPYASFHAGYQHTHLQPATVVENAVKNINELDRMFDRKILFETPVYREEFHEEDMRRISTHPSFVSSVLSRTKAGYLFDIGHVLLSGINRGKEHHIETVLKAAHGRIMELHVNVPQKIDGVYRDMHGLFRKGDEMSDRIIDVTRRILAQEPEVYAINLEMSTGLRPVEHAKAMAQQAEYFRNSIQ